MANRSDILAGKSYVELYLDKSLFTKGLKGVSAELKAFGAGVSAIGKKFMAVGASITAPLLAAAKSWASSGAEIYRMSQRTGMAVEKLSALKFAAEETGVEFETLEGGIKKMQKAIYASLSSKGGGSNFLRGLIGMSPEKQLGAIADKMASITNPTERAAFAIQVFGRSGTAMIPMLSKGAEGLNEMRKEAEAMGKIRSAEDAAAALQLSIAWKHLTGSIAGVKNALGSAVGPLLTSFFIGVQKNIMAARAWIKENKPLVAQIFKIGSAATAVGIGFFVVGKAVGFVAGILSSVVKVISVFGHAFSLLMVPIKLMGGLLSSVMSGAWQMLSSAVGVAKSALSMVGSIISGTVNAALWGLSMTLSAVTFGWDMFTGAVKLCRTVLSAFATAGDIIINVLNAVVAALTGAFSAIMTLVSLGPAALILLIPAAIALVIVFEELKAGVSEAADGVVQLGANIQESVTSAASAVKDAITGAVATVSEKVNAAGTAIREGAVSWSNAIWTFAKNLGSTVATVFDQMRSDAIAGFNNLVTDVSGSWNTLQSLISGGNFAEAWKLSLSIVKLEWVRFSGWLQGMWSEFSGWAQTTWDKLAPNANAAIVKIVDVVGDAFANMQISWGDLWDSILGGLHSFLESFDQAIDWIWKVIKEIRDEYNWWTRGDFWEDKEQQKKDDEEFARLSAKSNLARLVPKGRTAEEKAADDKATKEQGEKAKNFIKTSVAIPEKTQKEIEEGKQKREKEAKDAAAKNKQQESEAFNEYTKAQKNAATAAAESDKKRKEELEKLKGGTGGNYSPQDFALQMASGSAASRGTFSVAGVGGLGEGPIGKLHDMMKTKMERFVIVGENIVRAVKQNNMEAAP